MPLATVRLDYFDDKGGANRGTNLTILGTNCVYDLKQQTAASPDRLRLLTGDGRLTLEGRNWFWWQTNYDLVISNDVVTLAQMRDEPVPMRITADSCWLRYASNVVTYTGHVRAVDARLDLTCRTLTIQRGTNGARQTSKLTMTWSSSTAKVAGKRRASRRCSPRTVTNASPNCSAHRNGPTGRAPATPTGSSWTRAATRCWRWDRRKCVCRGTKRGLAVCSCWSRQSRRPRQRMPSSRSKPSG